jgi:methylglyoxal synthase
MDRLAVSGHDLDIETFARASRDFSVPVELTADTRDRIVKCRRELR